MLSCVWLLVVVRGVACTLSLLPFSSLCLPSNMSRKRELNGRDSTVSSDEDDQMVPTELAEPQPEAGPAQCGLLAPLGSAASSVVAPSGPHPSASPVLVHAPQSESDMLGASFFGGGY